MAERERQWCSAALQISAVGHVTLPHGNYFTHRLKSTDVLCDARGKLNAVRHENIPLGIKVA